MAKQYRGKSLKRLASRGRGTCPVCYATRAKLLYQRKKANGEALSVCKRCVDIADARLNLVDPLNQPVAYRRRHRKVFHAYVEQHKKRESS